MVESSSTATSRIFEFEIASPTPMFTTTFSIFGMAIAFLMPNSVCRRLRTCVLYKSFSLAAIGLFLELHLGIALAAETLSAFVGAMHAGARRLIAARTNDLQVRQTDRRFLLQDSAGHVLLRIGARVLLGQVDALDDRGALGRHHPQHAGLLAAVLAGEDAHRVALLDVRLARGMHRLFRCLSVH